MLYFTLEQLIDLSKIEKIQSDPNFFRVLVDLTFEAKINSEEFELLKLILLSPDFSISFHEIILKYSKNIHAKDQVQEGQMVANINLNGYDVALKKLLEKKIICLTSHDNRNNYYLAPEHLRPLEEINEQEIKKLNEELQKDLAELKNSSDKVKTELNSIGQVSQKQKIDEEMQVKKGFQIQNILSDQFKSNKQASFLLFSESSDNHQLTPSLGLTESNKQSSKPH